MVDTVWSAPATAYAAGGLDRETGQNLPAALWDRLISNLNQIGGATGLTWTTFTPTLTQLGAVTVTVTRARYQIVGKTAIVQIDLAVTAAGTAGNNITIASIPAAIAPAHTGNRAVCGSGIIVDNGTSIYSGTAIALTATTVVLQGYNTTLPIGSAPSFALASGDGVSVQLAYEIA